MCCLEVSTRLRVWMAALSTKWKTAKSSSSPPHGLAIVEPTLGAHTHTHAYILTHAHIVYSVYMYMCMRTSRRPTHESVMRESESTGKTKPKAMVASGANSAPLSTAKVMR